MYTRLDKIIIISQLNENLWNEWDSSTYCQIQNILKLDKF